MIIIKFNKNTEMKLYRGIEKYRANRILNLKKSEYIQNVKKDFKISLETFYEVMHYFDTGEMKSFDEMYNSINQKKRIITRNKLNYICIICLLLCDNKVEFI